MVVASVAWTAHQRERFAAAADDAGSIGPLVGLLAALGVVWIAGLVVVGSCAAVRTANSFVRDPLAWVRSIQDLGRASNSVLAALAGSRAFWLGWRVSWIATTLCTLLPALVAVARVGWSGVGVVGLATVSMGVNLGWRIPADARMRRLRAGARDVVAASLPSGI